MVVKTFLVIIVMQITRDHQYTGLDSLPSFVQQNWCWQLQTNP